MGGTTESTREQLANSQLLRGIPSDALLALSERVEHKDLKSGDVLCEVGAEGDSAYLVISGRFAAEAGGRVVGEIGRGELVGEISLLTGEPRSATVRALRDSEVLVVSSDLFNEVLARFPECYKVVSRQLVERLQRVLTTTLATDRATVITMIHDGRPVSREAVERFGGLLGDGATIVRDRSDDLASLEMANDVVVIAPEPGDEALRVWALGQCDRALLVVDAESRPLDVRGLVTGGRVELVLVHPPSTTCPSGTTRWLEALNPVGHHHIRQGSSADLERVARRLQSRESVLVLSGGGARGLAHAGLHRALEEHDIAIDAVAGVSAGAIAASIVAMGTNPVTGGQLANQLFAEGGSPIDLTIPTIALASGVRINERLKELCGETRTLEDLWIPISIVSTNLTTSDVHVHQKGLLWRAIRASTAIPGVFPPVADPAGLLVDGGVVANLPVDIVRRLHPGATVIASDVGKKMELLPEDFPEAAEISGWRAVRSRVRSDNKLPGMVRILAQLTALGGAGSAQSRGDLHIEFDLDNYGMFDFKKGSEIVEAGYQQSLVEVAEFARGNPGIDLVEPATALGQVQRQESPS